MFKSLWKKLFGKSTQEEPTDTKPSKTVARNVPFITDTQSLTDVLSASGLAEHAQSLVRHARYAAHLQHRGENVPLQPGNSRLGGRPDLPPGMSWPIRQALQSRQPRSVLPGLTHGPDQQTLEYLTTPQPLNFLAQINLAEVAVVAVPDLELPQQGMLYFFYDTEYQGWGFDPSDAPGFRVIFAPDTNTLAPVDMPPATIPIKPFVEVGLQPQLTFCPLPSEGILFDSLKLPKAAADIYDEVLRDDRDSKVNSKDWFQEPNWANCQLGGYPSVIQNPMEEECALVSAGIYCGDPKAYSSDEGKSVLSQENDWQLLLQIDSDEDAEMMWGDSGMLYFWIKKSRLQARDFSQVWLILQCS
jgi:uncharacterized protein YwqG